MLPQQRSGLENTALELLRMTCITAIQKSELFVEIGRTEKWLLSSTMCHYATFHYSWRTKQKEGCREILSHFSTVQASLQSKL